MAIALARAVVSPVQRHRRTHRPSSRNSRIVAFSHSTAAFIVSTNTSSGKFFHTGLTLTLRVLQLKQPPRLLRCALIRRFLTARLSSLRLRGESFLASVGDILCSIIRASCVYVIVMGFESDARKLACPHQDGENGWRMECRTSYFRARIRLSTNERQETLFVISTIICLAQENISHC